MSPSQKKKKKKKKEEKEETDLCINVRGINISIAPETDLCELV